MPVALATPTPLGDTPRIKPLPLAAFMVIAFPVSGGATAKWRAALAAGACGRNWSVASLSATQLSGRYWVQSGHRAITANRSFLTHFVISRAAIAVLHRQARDMLRSNPLGDAVLA